ncbi:MAG: trypsin-like peptidase domain-containing protein [Acidobacteria bacterium]|nr:trypsin-like peptidase domain-containing protein [Acidobacteriota bacterium]
MVEVFDEADLLVGQGSGVAVTSQLIVTNKHVIGEGEKYRVRKGNQTWEARVHKVALDSDLSLLRCEGVDFVAAEIRSPFAPVVGERVYAVGAPQGLELTLSDGLISGLRGGLIQTTAAISKGSSGGGLFDDAGRLVGITSFYFAKGQQLNFAIRAENILTLSQQSPEMTAEAWKTVGDGFLDSAHTSGPPSPPPLWGTNSELRRWKQEIGAELEVVHSQLRKAARAYRQALGIVPDDSDGWLTLALVHARLGERERMTSALTQALRIKPNDVPTLRRVAQAFSRISDHAEAAKAYERAIGLQPNDVSLWIDLANEYAFFYPKSANKALQHAQTMASTAYYWFRVGLVYDLLKDYKNARNAHEKALQLEPSNSIILSSLCLLHIMNGKYSEAKKSYQKLKAIDPQKARNLWESFPEYLEP